MDFRLFRILTIILSFFFLTGFVPILSLVGPSVTAITSGNIYKASAQFIINQHIEKKTGKNSLALIKETLINEEIDEKVEKEVVLEVNTVDEQNSYLTLTTTEKVLDQVTEKIEKCSGSKEEILLKLAEIESENVEIDKMILTKS